MTKRKITPRRRARAKEVAATVAPAHEAGAPELYPAPGLKGLTQCSLKVALHFGFDVSHVTPETSEATHASGDT